MSGLLESRRGSMLRSSLALSEPNGASKHPKSCCATPIGSELQPCQKCGQHHLHWARCTKAAARTQSFISKGCSARCPMPCGPGTGMHVLNPTSRHMLLSGMLKEAALPASSDQNAAPSLCSDQQHCLCCRPEHVRMTSASLVRSLTCVPWSPGTCQELVRSCPARCRHLAVLCLIARHSA